MRTLDAFLNLCIVDLSVGEEAEFFGTFARVFFEGVNLMERDWLLFWRFWVNHNLRRCFLIAKYIGWEETPKQMVGVIHSDNPIRFYRLSAKKPFYAVVLVGRSDTELDRFLRMLCANSVRMETGTFTLVSNSLGKDLIIKRVTQTEVLAQSYSLAHYSSFDGLWLLEDNEISLRASFDKIGGLLPDSLPQIGVVFEKIYDHSDEDRVPRIIESLEDQNLVDEIKLGSMLRSQAAVMLKSSTTLPQEFLRRYQPEPLVSRETWAMIGLGAAGVLFSGWVWWTGKRVRK